MSLQTNDSALAVISVPCYVFYRLVSGVTGNVHIVQDPKLIGRRWGGSFRFHQYVHNRRYTSVECGFRVPILMVFVKSISILSDGKQKRK